MGRFDVESTGGPDRTLWPEELSGVVWIGDERYLAIGDAHATIHPLTVRVDPVTGSVVSVRFDTPIPLREAEGTRIPEPAMAEDREGIVCDPQARSVWIANERTEADPRWPSIECYRLEDGRMTALLRYDSDPMLRVFERARPNRGFESLARSPDGQETWTASEGALDVDGPMASDTAGAFVRLQKFDRTMHPVAQVAYPVDSYPADIVAPPILAGRSVSGLSELAVLPDGRLLALERAFSGDSTGAPNLRSRIYLVDVSGATDVARGDAASGLTGRAFVPVKKVLLWERNWGLTNSNFEAMALGPSLRNGERLLLLVADNNEGLSQAFFTLRITGLPGP